MITKILSLLFIFLTTVITVNAAEKQSSSTDNDFENLNRIPVKLKIISGISTKNNIFEGQRLIFTTTEDAVLTHKNVLPAGSRVFGIVETISENEKFGIPANLIVGNFRIEYMPKIKLEGQILKIGKNRTKWIKPLSPLLFYIKGGQAKILEDEIFEVYYTPKDI